MVPIAARASAVLLFCSAMAGRLVADDYSPADLVSKYRAAVSRMASSSFDVHELTVREKFGTNGTIVEQWKYDTQRLCRRDGGRWRLEWDVSTDYLFNGKNGARQSSGIWLITDEGSLVIDRDPSSHEARSVVAEQQPSGNVGTIGDCMFAYGHVTDIVNKSFLPTILGEYLNEGRLSARQENRQWILSGSGRYGEYVLRIEPHHGFLPSSVVLTKRAGDIYEDKLVSAHPNLREVAISVNVSRSERSNQAWTPAEFEVIKTESYTDSRVTTTSKCVLSNLSVGVAPSRDSFRITNEIPDGMFVQVDDAPGLSFVWKDNMLVRAVNGKAFQATQGHSFAGGSWRRLTMIGANAALIATLLVLIAVRTHRRQSIA